MPRLAGQMPYPVYGAYLLLTQQSPAADPAFRPIPIEHEDAWQNAGYTVQWWLFAAMALLLYGWLAWKEAHGDAPVRSRPAASLDRAEDAELLDRVAESDRRAAARTADPATRPHK